MPGCCLTSCYLDIYEEQIIAEYSMHQAPDLKLIASASFEQLCLQLPNLCIQQRDLLIALADCRILSTAQSRVQACSSSLLLGCSAPYYTVPLPLLQSLLQSPR